VGERAENGQNPLKRLINWRVQAAMGPNPPSETLLKLQQPFYDLANKYWFRLEITGWERVPEAPCLVVGVRSGGALTMDAWTLVNAWFTHVEGRRLLHGMRSWRKRDVATLAGRTGFVKQAIRSGVPILPVATVGGHDTVFVLNEGKWLADALDKVLGLKKTLRGSNLPIIAGFPFPIAVEILPAHVPLPAKIRTELLDPIEVDHDPDRVDDRAYVQKIYDEVEAAIQAGMDRLAAKRKLPILG
jgi:1-acyl-sn-glycerol-3-phosphate acyltransferase